MLKFAFLLALSLTTAIGSQQRIIGGSVTTIGQYPFAAALLTSFNQNLVQSCGGTIINNRSVLTAAHCVIIYASSRYFVRVGSTNAHSGGTVYSVSQVFNHAGYSIGSPKDDISVIRVSTAFSFGTNVQVGRIAGSNYNIADNQVVWAIGWGVISAQGQTTEQLRHVQIWTVNQNTCRNNYANYYPVTNSMLCAGYLNVGGRDTCNRDSGGPLLHNGVVVGIVSHGKECGSARYPGIYTRVSSYANWIRDRA